MDRMTLFMIATQALNALGVVATAANNRRAWRSQARERLILERAWSDVLDGRLQTATVNGITITAPTPQPATTGTP